MKARTAALLIAGLLLVGSVFLTGCDDAPPPQVPGVEEQDGAEEEVENDGQNDGQDDD